MAERVRQFQIHDGTFGRALYERDTAIDALLDYFADRRRGEIRSEVSGNYPFKGERRTASDACASDGGC